ncbi:NDP-hexose 2,3-dehydratase family protein [Nonomuraea longicatena]|uniref:NDP-hexose 2,3-dehydratase family protein n=1 Tax=Nonomuraea longicatena TaxID=83682 RepID=A0ABP4A196_9ACTN
MKGSQLRPREDLDLPVRFARSAAATEGSGMRTDDVSGWIAERATAAEFSVERIPFAELDGWRFEKDTGNLVHRSGRFFTVEGLRVRRDAAAVPEWHQPIIRQHEVGILGILAKEFDGVLHFLMQAKMEPGNPRPIQLSPTVQATRSNYTRAHRGARVKYLEYFREPERHGRVLADVLQSEHGSWFLRKRNRNMIVEVFGDVPLLGDFRWLTLGQIGELLHRDNLVNMDARTVLACAPVGRGTALAAHSDADLLSWFTAERSGHEVSAEPVPLSAVPGWVRRESAIEHEDGRYFRVVAVAVRAGSREVTCWTQPLFEPCGEGVIAMFARRIGGVPHVLVHARVEGGFVDGVELGPTVQYMPANYAHLAAGDRPLFVDLALSPDPERVLYQAMLSEEGGRFRNTESRYTVIEVDESQVPDRPPSGYRWVTPGQLGSLVRHPHYVNVQARTLLACFNTRAVRW